MTRPVSFPTRLDQLAAADPDRDAITFLRRGDRPTRVSRAELALASRRLASLLRTQGTGPGDTVIIALPNHPLHFVAAYAVWRLGACALPLGIHATAFEKLQLVEASHPRAIVGDWIDAPVPVIRVHDLDAFAAVPPIETSVIVAHPGKAIASGGSTGRPKVIVDPNPWQGVPGGFIDRYPLGWRSGQVQFVVGPLYHNAAFMVSHVGLFEEHSLVLLDRFDVDRVLAAVQAYRVNWCYLSPTMMHRLIKSPAIRRCDWSSLEMLYHTSAPCPAWLKEAWIDLLGPERVVEAYGSTEAVGAAVIRGDEWLAHRGSVGRPLGSEVRVIGPDGVELPRGEVGLVCFRPTNEDATYQYRGAEPLPETLDGFVSVGDLGWVDSDGYVYLAERRSDLIITGGVNVYPAEVEGVLLSHPAVADAVVFGLPNEEWGSRVHAAVQLVPDSAGLSIEELDRFVRMRLSGYKVPRSYEFVVEIPRNEAGKVRRRAMVAERTAEDVC